MLDDLLAVEDGLSEWEVEFIDSLDRNRDVDLSDKQADKLKQLHERHC